MFSMILMATLVGQLPERNDITYLVRGATAVGGFWTAVLDAPPELDPGRRDITHMALGATACGGFGTALIDAAAEADRASARSEREQLIARRRGKRASRYVARTRREAAEAQQMARAQAEARAQYQRMLPYLLEARRQDLLRAAAHEQAEATRAVGKSIERAAGYAEGTTQRPRIVNMPGQPYAP